MARVSLRRPVGRGAQDLADSSKYYPLHNESINNKEVASELRVTHRLGFLRTQRKIARAIDPRVIGAADGRIQFIRTSFTKKKGQAEKIFSESVYSTAVVAKDTATFVSQLVSFSLTIFMRMTFLCSLCPGGMLTNADQTTNQPTSACIQEHQ